MKQLSILTVLLVCSAAWCQSDHIDRFESREAREDRYQQRNANLTSAAPPPIAVLGGRFAEVKKVFNGKIDPSKSSYDPAAKVVTATTDKNETLSYEPEFQRPVYVHKKDQTVIENYAFEGKEQTRSTDPLTGEVTITTTKAHKFTYDPSSYDLVSEGERTVLKLRAGIKGTAGLSFTSLPGGEGHSVSLARTVSPYGQALEPDSKGSNSLKIAYTSTRKSGSTGDKGKLHDDYQFNSDYDVVQAVGGLDVVAARKAGRQIAPFLTFTFLPDTNITIGLTGTYEDNAFGKSGSYASVNLQFDVNDRFSLYTDQQAPSRVEGASTWDVGLIANLIPKVKFTLEADEGNVWIFAVSHSFRSM